MTTVDRAATLEIRNPADDTLVGTVGMAAPDAVDTATVLTGCEPDMRVVHLGTPGS